MKAIWNNQVIAESNETLVIEGNHYFPLESVKKEFLQPSDTQTTCPWKGLASYSVHAHETTPGVVPYATSKGAIEAFTRGISLEYKSSQVRINCVAPGAVDTPML